MLCHEGVPRIRICLLFFPVCAAWPQGTFEDVLSDFSQDVAKVRQPRTIESRRSVTSGV